MHTTGDLNYHKRTKIRNSTLRIICRYMLLCKVFKCEKCLALFSLSHGTDLTEYIPRYSDIEVPVFTYITCTLRYHLSLPGLITVLVSKLLSPIVSSLSRYQIPEVTSAPLFSWCCCPRTSHEADSCDSTDSNSDTGMSNEIRWVKVESKTCSWIWSTLYCSVPLKRVAETGLLFTSQYPYLVCLSFTEQ